MAQRELFNANTQQVETAELSVDASNEIVATFEDGSVLKFPAGLTPAEFEELIAAHEEQNSGKEVITPEMEAARDAERAASLALIGEEEDSEPTEE